MSVENEHKVHVHLAEHMHCQLKCSNRCVIVWFRDCCFLSLLSTHHIAPVSNYGHNMYMHTSKGVPCCSMSGIVFHVQSEVFIISHRNSSWIVRFVVLSMSHFRYLYVIHQSFISRTIPAYNPSALLWTNQRFSLETIILPCLSRMISMNHLCPLRHLNDC